MSEIEVKDEKPVEFSINSSIYAMSVLSKSLYSNPIQAIVRELACNAIDSHIAAGTPEVKFDINLTDNNFVIRDYGTGLAPNDVEKIYTTYFGSTKEEDNTSIGSFGLGSKSPFAYTDEFCVKTYYYGTCTTYVAKKELVNLTLTKTKVDFTAKPNGLEISFNIKDSKDRCSFYEAMDRVLPFMEGKYSSNTQINPLPVDIKLDNCLILQKSYVFNKGFFALQNHVVYNIDANKLNDSVKHFIAQYSGIPRNFTFIFPNKSLSVAPSREELHYDSATIYKLNEVVLQGLDELRTHIDKEIDSISVFELRTKHDLDILDLLPACFNKSENYKGTYRTYPVYTYRFQSYVCDVQTMTMISRNQVQNPHDCKQISYNELLSKNIVINDLEFPERGVLKAKRYLKDQNTHGGSIFYLSSLEVFEKFCIDLALPQDIIDKCIFLSKINTKTPKERNVSKKRIFIQYNSNDNILPVKDIEDINHYFFTNYNNPIVFGNTLVKESRGEFRRLLKDLNIDAVGVSKKDFEESGITTWTNVDKVILEKYNELFYALCTEKEVCNISLLHRFEFLKDIPGEKVITKLLESVDPEHIQLVRNRYAAYNSIHKYLPQEKKVALEIPTIDLEDVIYKAYPMLQFISNCDSLTGNKKATVADYVKGLINAEHRQERVGQAGSSSVESIDKAY